MAKRNEESAQKLIDERIKTLDDWRGKALSRVRKVITQADSEIVEEVKWRKPTNPLGVPTWSRSGIVCTGETYKDKVKLTFAKGAALKDPSGLFNASLIGNTRRAIDIHERDELDEAALEALVREAIAENTKGKACSAGSKPKLLSGGNPQIPKGDGDAPVQAYIAAMPGWKHSAGRRLDALIKRAVPDVHKAVKWNSPFYGLKGQGWFLSFHCFTKYIKVTFFRGTSLRPVPPVESKTDETRYFHIYEHDELDDAQLTAWVKQASRLPGEKL